MRHFPNRFESEILVKFFEDLLFKFSAYGMMNSVRRPIGISGGRQLERLSETARCRSGGNVGLPEIFDREDQTGNGFP